MTQSTDLVLAFAFSLMPDAAPGSYNLQLAQHLATVLQKRLEENDGELPYVGVQWEIADALATLNSSVIQRFDDNGKWLVVEPPQFEPSQIAEPELYRWLVEEKSEHVGLLQRWLRDAEGKSVTEQLNSLLTQARFYEDFEPLALANLVRPQLGELFTEHRRMPHSQDYPVGLGKYQRKRVNRLIIERIVDNAQLVQRGHYLSTSGVIEFVLDNINADYQRVGIIAHPLHAGRCIEQTKRSMSAHRPNVSIYGAGPNAAMAWEDKTAQLWCRSAANWREYERRVQRLLK